MTTRSKNDDANASMDSFRRIVQALRSSHRAASDVDLTGAQLFVLSTLARVGRTTDAAIARLAVQRRPRPSEVCALLLAPA